MGKLSLTEITPHLLYSFRSEHELTRAIEELSRKFTKERELIEDYLKDPRLVSAYTAFYLTTNFPKFEAILPWLPKEWVETIKSSDLIDLGAGPGTFSLAWKTWAGEASGKIYQIEKSAIMQEQAKKLWKGIHPGSELYQMQDWREKNDRPKTVIFGHSANEMGPDLVLDYLANINPDHILFIEPGTKNFFPQMLSIREALLKSGHHVLYPCPKELECPMRGTEDWCHQFIHVSHSPDVERLTQLVEKDRKLLPLIVHAYTKADLRSDSEERIVRVLPETKFSFEWEVCHNNHLEHYQVMKRDLSKSESKAFSNTLAGEGIKTETTKILDQFKRVKVIR
jgi:hypothetical protein